MQVSLQGKGEKKISGCDIWRREENVILIMFPRNLPPVQQKVLGRCEQQKMLLWICEIKTCCGAFFGRKHRFSVNPKTKDD